MFSKTDIFVDAGLKPYNFYLCHPLDKSQMLIKMIENNGGKVVNDYTQTCIIISSKDYEIPEDLKSAHIYSYEVIQDSVNRGAQQEFTKYLIYIPHSSFESVPQQFNDDKVSNSVGDNNDDYNYEEFKNSLTDHSSTENNANHLSSQTNNLFHNENTENSLVSYQDHSVRYFTAEEDSVLKEEIRKRHYMGIKGHSIYEEISRLPYFMSRMRTPASLRERMRTIKYNVGYVYKVDKKNNLLKDSDGNYIKTTQITAKLTPYTAEDDVILCKTIYFMLEIVTDVQGFEHIVYPTNFFDRFALVYDNHTPESWRQRCKNYLSYFGIVNYLKYYIMQCKIGSKPLPSNTADKEFLAARKKIKGKPVPIIYLPNIPQDNKFIDDNIEFITPEGYDNKIFEFDNPFRNGNIDNSLGSDKEIKHEESVKIKEKESESILNHEEEEKIEGSTQNSTEDSNRESIELPKDNKYEESSKALSSNKNDNEQKDINLEQEKEHIEPIYNDSNDQSPEYIPPQNSGFDEINQAADQVVNQMSNQTVNQIVNKETNKKEDIKGAREVNDEFDNDEFIDEKTTEFTQVVFKRALNKWGVPIDLEKIGDKNGFIEKLRDLLIKERLPPFVLTKKLLELDVKQYYTVFLLYRCNSERDKIFKSIVNYINTNGKELLLTEPGIWSDKTIKMYEQEDPKLNEILIKYHGLSSFKKRERSAKKQRKK